MREFFTPKAEEAVVEQVEVDGHMSISAPWGFKQLVHVTVDATSPSGFRCSTKP